MSCNSSSAPVGAPPNPCAVEIARSSRARPLLTLDYIGPQRKEALLIELLSEAFGAGASTTLSAEIARESALPLRPGLLPDKEDTNLLGPGRPHFQGERLRGTQDPRVELEEARTILAAWHSQFGTNQLSHAVAKMEGLAEQVRRLQAEIGPLREAVGVRADATSAPTDIAHWSKLMAQADRVAVAEGAVAILRRALGCFASRNLWFDRNPGLQWAGKRNPITYAEEILRETAPQQMETMTASRRFVVEAQNLDGVWSTWYVEEGGRVLNPCDTLEEAFAIRADLDSYRTTERTGWRDSRIVIETVVRQIAAGEAPPASSANV